MDLSAGAALRGAQRADLWIWTAVVEEPDGRRWADFAVGDRSAAPFLRLYARLPEAQQYCSDRYSVYAEWLPPAQHRVGKGGPVNWNEGL